MYLQSAQYINNTFSCFFVKGENMTYGYVKKCREMQMSATGRVNPTSVHFQLRHDRLYSDKYGSTLGIWYLSHSIYRNESELSLDSKWSSFLVTLVT